MIKSDVPLETRMKTHFSQTMPYPSIPAYMAESLPHLQLPWVERPGNDPIPQILGGQDWSLPSGALLSVVSPATQTLLGLIQTLGKNPLSPVMEAAQEGFEAFSQTQWEERSLILENLALLLEAHQEPLSQWIALEVGKPIKLATMEVQRAIRLARGYARKTGEIALQERSESPVALGKNHQAYYSLRPLGPVLAYTPFNFPLNLVMHKLAPAIAAGTSILIKPSPKAPFTALYLAKLAIAAGYLPISMLNLSNEQALKLVCNPVFKVFSFTGGAIGWDLAKAAPVDTVKILELGSRTALMVEDIAHAAQLDEIAKKAALSGFGFAGQSCISTQRILVNRALYPEFLSAFERASQLVMIGDVLDHTVDLGPMITPEAARLANSRIAEALSAGARLLEDPDSNRLLYEGWLKPTTLVDTTPEMAVNREELFAPVVTITPYERFETGLALANDPASGLQTGLFTQSLEKARQAQQALSVRGLTINEVPSFRDDRLPYGGIGRSGMGAEGVDVGIENYSTRIYRVHNLGF